MNFIKKRFGKKPEKPKFVYVLIEHDKDEDSIVGVCETIADTDIMIHDYYEAVTYLDFNYYGESGIEGTYKINVREIGGIKKYTLTLKYYQLNSI